MEAIQYDASSKQLALSQVEIPRVQHPDDVLIQVAYAGVCGTDLHIIAGEFACDKTRPITLGHEFSGVVKAIGAAVTVVKVGDKVSVDPNHGCGKCLHCLNGNVHFCEAGGLNSTVGIYRHGGWAQYCLVPEAQVHKLPHKISLQQGALCEPLSCLAHGWDRLSPMHVGQKILILGAGIIGNLWVVALHHQGHRNVTVSEPNKARLDLIKSAGTGFDLITPDELKQKATAQSDYTFDLIIDCSGFAPAIEYAFSLLSKGGKLCIFGVAPPHAKISVSPFEMFQKEISIIGVIINPFTFPKALGLVEAMGDRYLSYSALGVKTFKLSQYAEAIKELKSGTIAKAMFEIAK